MTTSGTATRTHSTGWPTNTYASIVRARSYFMSLVSNTIDLMYIQDAEKYRATAEEEDELFEIVVARAVAAVIRNWVNVTRKAES